MVEVTIGVVVVVVDVVEKLGVACRDAELPVRYVKASLELCGRYLAEIIVPLVVVGVEMLGVIVRLLERSAEMGIH